jgi:hypothetical protein
MSNKRKKPMPNEAAVAEAPPEPVQAIEPPKPRPPLYPIFANDVKLESEKGFRRRVFWAKEWEQPEDMLANERWMGVAKHLNRWDVITCICEGGEWIAEIRVAERGPDYVRMQMDTVREYNLRSAIKTRDGYKVVYDGPDRQYIAVRSTDGVLILQGAASKEEAARQLDVILGQKD